MTRRSFFASTAVLAATTVSPAFASFHLMKIEQAIGGVGGDTAQQAVQLRMRAPGQNLVGGAARLRAWDAAGANPVTLIEFPADVAIGNLGSRILVVSPGFAAAQTAVTADFTMTAAIPASYLPAGKLTFEDLSGNVYWGLAWGGAAYTGSNTGLTDNDADGNFNPPFWSALPSLGTQALAFAAADPSGSASSTTNLADYDRTVGAAVLTNNAGASGPVTGPPVSAKFHTVSPCRVVDTRSGLGGTTGPLPAGSTTTFTVAGACGIPVSASAVAFNVTAVGHNTVGNLRVYPAGAPEPTASTINFQPGATRANNGVVALGTAGQVRVKVDMLPGGSTHVVLDVSGYFQPGNTVTTLDTTGIVGPFTSVAIGADGLGLIAYFDQTNSQLEVAHCDDLACTTATRTTLDSGGGAYTSVAIGVDGLGLISYFSGADSDLKVAHCSNLACTSATLTTLDMPDAVGRHTSIAIGADGLGLISYQYVTTNDLRVAHCSDVACTSATITTIDSAGAVGEYTSVAIGADGLGLISYHDSGEGNLKVAHCSNVACTSATTSTLDIPGTVGEYTSVAIGTDGLGLISYYDQTNFDLKVAHCINLTCTSATTTPLDTFNSVGEYTSVTIGPDGRGLISYYDEINGDLEVAHCSNVACTTATLSTVDSLGNAIGQYTSVTIGADGLGLISYFDATNGNLKVAHCGNAFCRP
jgi:preprotein translocase subunit Sec61beta